MFTFHETNIEHFKVYGKSERYEHIKESLYLNERSKKFHTDPSNALDEMQHEFQFFTSKKSEK